MYHCCNNTKIDSWNPHTSSSNHSLSMVIKKCCGYIELHGDFNAVKWLYCDYLLRSMLMLNPNRYIINGQCQIPYYNVWYGMHMKCQVKTWTRNLGLLAFRHLMFAVRRITFYVNNEFLFYHRCVILVANQRLYLSTKQCSLICKVLEYCDLLLPFFTQTFAADLGIHQEVFSQYIVELNVVECPVA